MDSSLIQSNRNGNILLFRNLILLADRIIYRETDSEEAGAALSPHLQNFVWRHNCKQLPQPPRDYLFVWNIRLSPQARMELLTNTSPQGEDGDASLNAVKMPNTPTTHGSVTHHGVGILKSYTPVSGGVTKVLLQWEDSCTGRCWFCLPMLNGIQKWSCLSQCCSGRGGGVLSSCKTDERADSGAPVWLGSLWQKQCLKSSRWKVPRSCPYPDFLMFSVEIFPSWGVVGGGVGDTKHWIS